MMRCAVFRPMPFTLFSAFSLPVDMMFTSSVALVALRIMRAVLLPTPLTVMSIRYISRSCFVAKPYSVMESSRPPVINTSCTYSFTSFFSCMAVYVLSDMLSR